MSAHQGFAGQQIDRDHVKFGRIYASGRADYIRLVDANDPHTYNLEFYENTGYGGTTLKGDGVHYCDMYGKGHDDYLWASNDGRISLYENDDSPPTWTCHDQTDLLDTGRDRKSLHFGGMHDLIVSLVKMCADCNIDWNGDGLCDVLSIDKHTGNVDMWQNTYSGSGAVPTFEYKGRGKYSDGAHAFTTTLTVWSCW